MPPRHWQQFVWITWLVKGKPELTVMPPTFGFAIARTSTLTIASLEAPTELTNTSACNSSLKNLFGAKRQQKKRNTKEFISQHKERGKNSAIPTRDGKGRAPYVSPWADDHGLV